MPNTSDVWCLDFDCISASYTPSKLEYNEMLLRIFINIQKSSVHVREKLTHQETKQNLFE